MQSILSSKILFGIFFAAQFGYSIEEWEPLNVGLIFADGPTTENVPSPKIMNFLFSAIERMRSAVRVESMGHLDGFLLRDKLAECTAKKLSAIELTLDSHVFNFHLFIQMDLASVCASTATDLLAAAAPCLVPPFWKRPLLGKLVICTRNKRWPSYNGGADLFRHEILHALGFGMIIAPPKSVASAPPSRSIDWQLRNGSVVQRIVHFMDFADQATMFARHHFSCPSIGGIEADSVEKMHLSEYIFGNELMTPVLDAGPNHFTLLSALILEQTHLGERAWYRTNRALVERETRAYWWGRHFGCAFHRLSCFELLHRQLSAPVFCTKHDLNQSRLGKKSKALCFSNGARQMLKCQMKRRLETDAPSEQAIKPITLNSQFGDVFGANEAHVYGSEFDHHYCPIPADLFSTMERFEEEDGEAPFLIEC